MKIQYTIAISVIGGATLLLCFVIGILCSIQRRRNLKEIKYGKKDDWWWTLTHDARLRHTTRAKALTDPETMLMCSIVPIPHAIRDAVAKAFGQNFESLVKDPNNNLIKEYFITMHWATKMDSTTEHPDWNCYKGLTVPGSQFYYDHLHILWSTSQAKPCSNSAWKRLKEWMEVMYSKYTLPVQIHSEKVSSPGAMSVYVSMPPRKHLRHSYLDPQDKSACIEEMMENITQADYERTLVEVAQRRANIPNPVARKVASDTSTLATGSRGFEVPFDADGMDNWNPPSPTPQINQEALNVVENESFSSGGDVDTLAEIMIDHALWTQDDIIGALKANSDLNQTERKFVNKAFNKGSWNTHYNKAKSIASYATRQLTLKQLSEKAIQKFGEESFEYAGKHYYSLEESCVQLKEWCVHQQLDPVEFVTSMCDWFDKLQSKKNTVHLHGPSNSGKSWIFEPFMLLCPKLAIISAGGLQDRTFTFNDVPGSRWVMISEFLVRPDDADMLKMLFGGETTQVKQKHTGAAVVSKTPIAVTLNTSIISSVHSSLDKQALLNRFIIDHYCRQLPENKVLSGKNLHPAVYCKYMDIKQLSGRERMQKVLMDTQNTLNQELLSMFKRMEVDQTTASVLQGIDLALPESFLVDYIKDQYAEQNGVTDEDPKMEHIDSLKEIACKCEICDYCDPPNQEAHPDYSSDIESTKDEDESDNLQIDEESTQEKEQGSPKRKPEDIPSTSGTSKKAKISEPEGFDDLGEPNTSSEIDPIKVRRLQKRYPHLSDPQKKQTPEVRAFMFWMTSEIENGGHLTATWEEWNKKPQKVKDGWIEMCLTPRPSPKQPKTPTYVVEEEEIEECIQTI